MSDKWQIRCLTCGRARRAEDAGIVRVGAAGRKYTLAWCSACRWLRRAVIEAVPPTEFDVPMPEDRGAAPPGRRPGGGD